MKFVVLLLVLLAAVAWLALGRRRGRGDTPAPPPPPAAPGTPQAMVACAHCGVHLPQADALQDAAGHAYCSEAHRRAGPRVAG